MLLTLLLFICFLWAWLISHPLSLGHTANDTPFLPWKTILGLFLSVFVFPAWLKFWHSPPLFCHWALGGLQFPVITCKKKPNYSLSEFQQKQHWKLIWIECFSGGLFLFLFLFLGLLCLYIRTDQNGLLFFFLGLVGGRREGYWVERSRVYQTKPLFLVINNPNFYALGKRFGFSFLLTRCDGCDKG